MAKYMYIPPVGSTPLWAKIIGYLVGMIIIVVIFILSISLLNLIGHAISLTL